MNRKEEIQKHIKALLQLIGDNSEREGLKGTPERVARMFGEIYRGYDPAQKPKITTFQNGVDGIVYGYR